LECGRQQKPEHQDNAPNQKEEVHKLEWKSRNDGFPGAEGAYTVRMLIEEDLR